MNIFQGRLQDTAACSLVAEAAAAAVRTRVDGKCAASSHGDCKHWEIVGVWAEINSNGKKKQDEEEEKKDEQSGNIFRHLWVPLTQWLSESVSHWVSSCISITVRSNNIDDCFSLFTFQTSLFFFLNTKFPPSSNHNAGTLSDATSSCLFEISLHLFRTNVAVMEVQLVIHWVTESLSQLERLSCFSLSLNWYLWSENERRIDPKASLLIQ